MLRWGRARKNLTADCDEKEARGGRRMARDKKSGHFQQSRSAIDSPAAIFLISMFVCESFPLTFTLTVRRDKGLTHTHQDFIPQRCCHMISCSVCHLSVIYRRLFFALSFTLNELVWPEAPLHMEDRRASRILWQFLQILQRKYSMNTAERGHRGTDTFQR